MALRAKSKPLAQHRSPQLCSPGRHLLAPFLTQFTYVCIFQIEKLHGLLVYSPQDLQSSSQAWSTVVPNHTVLQERVNE